KGQRGKAWITAPGENIMMSAVLAIKNLSLHDQFPLSAGISLGCFDLLNTYLPGKIFIKWPNDLYIGDRKAGGILIENIISGEDWKYAIAGTGININQVKFDEHLPNPTSLKTETGKHFDAVALAKQLCILIEKRFNDLCNENSDRIVEEYNNHLYKKNTAARLKKGNIIFETIIQGVSKTGRLMTKDVMERNFDFGEIEWQL
ncbi:MAG: biotin--[acetyl-CoA-carboxylase] ligase, partial [Bacteroidota bacterium]